MMAADGIVARRHRRRRGPDPPRRDRLAASRSGRAAVRPGRRRPHLGRRRHLVPTDEGWLYLASVLDLGSRRLLGYAMSKAADTDQIINAVAMAVAVRGRSAMPGTIFHSDRGSTDAGRARMPGQAVRAGGPGRPSQ
jgi:putative transposase